MSVREFIKEYIYSCDNIKAEQDASRSSNADYWAFGHTLQIDRLKDIASWCINNYPGDLVEIGCFEGEASCALAELAHKHGRTLYSVDPWEVGT